MASVFVEEFNSEVKKIKENCIEEYDMYIEMICEDCLTEMLDKKITAIKPKNRITERKHNESDTQNESHTT